MENWKNNGKQEKWLRNKNNANCPERISPLRGANEWLYVIYETAYVRSVCTNEKTLTGIKGTRVLKLNKSRAHTINKQELVFFRKD